MSCCQNNEEKQGTCSSEGKKNYHRKGLIVLLLLVSILVNLGTGYYLKSSIADTVSEKILSNEYQKA